MPTSGDPQFSTIESERLILRRFCDSDLHNFVAYRAHPDVARYQSWSPDFDLEDGKSFIEELRSLYPGILGKWFQFAVQLKKSPHLIGDCALHVQIDDPTQAEIGFSFSPGFQGQGYAIEAVSTLLTYAFGKLGLSRIFAITDRENINSIRLLQKTGMFKENEIDGSEYLYSLSREGWAQSPYSPLPKNA